MRTAILRLGDQHSGSLAASRDAHGPAALRLVYQRGQLVARLGDRILALFHCGGPVLHIAIKVAILSGGGAEIK